MKIKTLALMVCVLMFTARLSSAESPEKPVNNVKTANHAFVSGERLTYVVSWSKILKAGTASMEVKEEKTAEVSSTS